MADNKPSIEFHERGKRHKENVEKRLKEISKKSQKDQRAQQKMDDDIRKMEQNAMKSYMKDVHAQADYSSQFVTLPDGWKPEPEKVLEGPSLDAKESPHPSKASQAAPAKKSSEYKGKKPSAAGGSAPRPKPPTLVGIQGVQGAPAKHVKNYVHQKKLPKWYEAKSGDGASYYWNTITGATSFDEPDDGFVSLELQAKNLEAIEEKRKKQEEQWDIVKNPLKVPLGPAEKPNPYGSWQTVETICASGEVDLQLPKVEKVELQVPILTEEEPIKFKEKRMKPLESSGGTSEPAVFKKRKMQRFNVRQRLDDD